MRDITIVFHTPALAECLVAGVPAAARAVRAMRALAEEGARFSIAAGTPWVPSTHLLNECRRLAPGSSVSFVSNPSDRTDGRIGGEALVAATASKRHGDPAGLREAMTGQRAMDMTKWSDDHAKERALAHELRGAGWAIVSATGKAGDGIVSRYLNRPISRAISLRLLRISGARPFHASLGTALLAMIMTAALLLDGYTGLVAGALLFQAASIFDGVDGEMARATFRESTAGATLDSVIDAMTNLSFFIGVAFNAGIAGDAGGAAAGVITIVTFAGGLTMIGRRARAIGQPVNFDIVKRELGGEGKPHPIVQILIWATMRDTLALVCALAIVSGLVHCMLTASAVVALGWFAVVSVVLIRSSPRTAHDHQHAAARG